MAAGRVDSLNPEVAKIAFPSFSVAVRPVLGLHRGIFSITEKLGSTPAVSLSFVENSFAALSARARVSCSWHVSYPTSAGPSAQVVVSHSSADLTCRISPENSGTGGERSASFSVKRQVCLNPLLVRFIDNGGLGELTLALCIFRRKHVPAARLATQYLAGRRHLEAFRHGLLRLTSRYRFWHKEPAIYLQDPS